MSTVRWGTAGVSLEPEKPGSLPLPATLWAGGGWPRPSLPVSQSPFVSVPHPSSTYAQPARENGAGAGFGQAPHLDHVDVPVRQVQHQQDEQVEDLVLQRECKVCPHDLGQESAVDLKGCQAQGLLLLGRKTPLPLSTHHPGPFPSTSVPCPLHNPYSKGHKPSAPQGCVPVSLAGPPLPHAAPRREPRHQRTVPPRRRARA